MIEKKSLYKWLVSITGVLGSILLLISQLEKIDNYMCSYIVKAVNEAPKKEGFRTLLANEIGQPSDRIHIVFGQMYNNIKETQLNIDAFNEEYIPMLKEEKNTIRVGLYVKQGRVKYLNTEGQEYDAVLNTTGTSYYYWKDNKWNTCQ